MSTLRLTTLSNQGGTATVPSDTVINGTAKAWVNFNGQGTVAIRQSFNVSSVTDSAVGQWTINFTNAMSDTNYVTTVSSHRVSSWNDGGDEISTITTSSVRVVHVESATTTDTDIMAVAVFR